MSLRFHWFLPTNGDGRDIVGGGHGVATGAAGAIRPASLAYLGQIARSAEQLGFEAALTPTGAWCEDAWLTTAMLTEVTERLKFLVAFRPGLISPTLSAQMAGPVAARYTDVYLTWGEPPAAVNTKLRWMDSLARQAGRTLRYGIRLHVITRDTSHEAWMQANRLIEGVDEAMIRTVQEGLGHSESEGQRRMRELHGGSPDNLEVSPTCGPASACSAAAPGRRWSAATSRWPTGSRNTPGSACPSSSCPAIRTWRRPTGSVKACCRSCAGAACGSTPTRTPSTTR